MIKIFANESLFSSLKINRIRQCTRHCIHSVRSMHRYDFDFGVVHQHGVTRFFSPSLYLSFSCQMYHFNSIKAMNHLSFFAAIRWEAINHEINERLTNVCILTIVALDSHLSAKEMKVSREFDYRTRFISWQNCFFICLLSSFIICSFVIRFQKTLIQKFNKIFRHIAWESRKIYKLYSSAVDDALNQH